MDFYPVAIEKLIEEFAKLPSIGKKTAQRLTLHILNLPEDEVKEFATALVRARGTIKYCSICGNFTETDPCPICSNPSRDKSVICVVEQPKDIMTMEKVKEFNGTYHVLHGNLSPMQGRGPQDIKIRELVARMNADVKEVINRDKLYDHETEFKIRHCRQGGVRGGTQVEGLRGCEGGFGSG